MDDTSELVRLVKRMREAQEATSGISQSLSVLRGWDSQVRRLELDVDAWLAAWDAHEVVRQTTPPTEEKQ